MTDAPQNIDHLSMKLLGLKVDVKGERTIQIRQAIDELLSAVAAERNTIGQLKNENERLRLECDTARREASVLQRTNKDLQRQLNTPRPPTASTQGNEPKPYSSIRDQKQKLLQSNPTPLLPTADPTAHRPPSLTSPHHRPKDHLTNEREPPRKSSSSNNKHNSSDHVAPV